MDEKHGGLGEDELAVRASVLDERFSSHLSSLADVGQVIALKNTGLPAGISITGTVTIFTKRIRPDMRYRFFPID
ncbi:hypothetical protein [Methylorubrum thiocyanatum]|uniref:Uncharacterized protein n=1 Tax=Methylorubrum thiocyanatum TaxID=47958 RepID=A0AA40S561_9HYPH|nr:hypothetical protein [Methylorubrum thiocyanatum]MBA8914724.1 hypothetical protein [Methylorubrum thiocyanatum]GJE79137.1 hypothetical protein CJNNKLLH_0463 [Methylorubrum thiocyanatum]